MKGFWNTEIISGTAINYLPTPSFGTVSLNVILYILIIIIIFFLLWREKDRSGNALKRAVLLAFGAGFLLFTLRMDLNWISLMREDAGNLFGKSTAERFRYLDGNDFYEFMEFVRDSIPKEESVRDETNFESETVKQIHEMGSYYLLPKLTSSKGRYIWVYHRPEASYDPKSGILKLNNTTSYLVKPHVLFKANEVVFKIVGEL